jgi:hypothetical protein
VDTWPHRLFNDGSLADYLIDRWHLLSIDLDQAQRLAGDGLMGRAEALAERYTLTVPTVGSNFHIIEHGPMEDSDSDPDLMNAIHPDGFADEDDFIEAQIRQVEAKIRRLSRTRTIIAVPFTGDGVLFRFRPSGCLLPAPPGKIDGQSIVLRFKRSGREDKTWKGELAANLDNIEAILDCARPEVESFNATISKALQCAT